MAKITIEVRNEKGILEKFEQKHISTLKMIDLYEASEKEADKEKTQSEVIKNDARDIAALFDDERVTDNFLMNGIEIWNWTEFSEGVFEKLMEIDPKLPAVNK